MGQRSRKLNAKSHVREGQASVPYVPVSAKPCEGKGPHAGWTWQCWSEAVGPAVKGHWAWSLARWASLLVA